MICKRCKSNIPEDSRFCNYCGKMIKENNKSKNKVLSFFILILIFGLSVSIIGIVVMTVQNKNLSELVSVFLGSPEDPEIIPSKTTEPVENDKIGVTTPPLKTEDRIELGYLSDNCITSDKYYFLDDTKEKTYYLNLGSSETTLVLSEKIESFYVSKNILYYYTLSGLYKMDLENEKVAKILDNTNLEKIYISRDFIYYTTKNVNELYKINRIDMAGNNFQVVKDNVLDFYIDDDTASIYYSRYIDIDSYDNRNEFAAFMTLPTDLETGKFLTLLKCDLTGKSDLKIAEKLITENSSATINGFLKTINDIGFIINENGNKNFCVISNNHSDFEIINNVDYIYANRNSFFYSKQKEDKPYIMELHSYNPTLMENNKVTEIFDYKSIFIKEDVIYSLIDNHKIISFDFDGENKKGVFDFAKMHNDDLGYILDIDDKFIYLKTGVISLSENKIIHFDKKTGDSTIYVSHDIIENKDNKWIELYFDFLSSKDVLQSGQVFGLSDIDSDGVCELFIGDKNTLLSSNNNFESIANTKIYTIDSNNNVVLITSDGSFQDNISFYNYLNENKFVTISEKANENTLSINQYIDDKIVTTPYLKAEFEQDTTFFKYENSDYIKIDYDEYNNLFATIENELFYIKKYQIDASNIIDGLYFNNYLDAEKYIN